MNYIKLTAAIALALSLSACSTFTAVTRNAPLETPALEPGQHMVQRTYDVQDMNFIASSDMRVSESNGYYPLTDIVWRGDPIGDRRSQIGSMFQIALERNELKMDGPVPVVIDVQLVRFHGVTERTRFSFGGVYNIIFDLTVRHAETGVVIEQTRRIEADLAAPGGVAALIAEQRGQTEKVRVTDFLTQVLWDELNGAYAATDI